MSNTEKRAEVPALGGESADTVERIVLRRTENVRLHQWTDALNTRFDGMIRVTKSDLANFLVRQHAEVLSEAEIKTIEAELFDEVRWLNWALAKVRQAKKEGRTLSLNDLMINREAIQNRIITRSEVAKRKRPKPAQVDSTLADSDVPNYSELGEG